MVLHSCYDVEGDDCSLTEFLSRFPRLKEVDCSTWATIANRQLVQLTPFELESLNMMLCRKITASGMAQTIAALSNSLQVLKVGKFHDLFLNAMTHCNRLTSLGVETFQRKFGGGKLFRSIIQRLEELWVGGIEGGDKMSNLDDFVCSNLLSASLRKVSFDIQLHHPGLVVQAILASCPNIQVIQLFEIRISVTTDNGRKVCDAAFNTPYKYERVGENGDCNEFKRDICANVPLRSSTGGLLTAEQLRALADRSGALLETITGNVDTWVDDATMTYFLSRCLGIAVLKLCCFRTFRITKTSMSKLFAHCPNITTLQLTGCNKIFNPDFLQMLEGFQADHLRSLCIDRFFTKEATLLKALHIIKQRMPKLYMLRVYRPGYRISRGSIGSAPTDIARWVRSRIEGAGDTAIDVMDIDVGINLQDEDEEYESDEEVFDDAYCDGEIHY